jgi:hypothetical protein
MRPDGLQAAAQFGQPVRCAAGDVLVDGVVREVPGGEVLGAGEPHLVPVRGVVRAQMGEQFGDLVGPALNAQLADQCVEITAPGQHVLVQLGSQRPVVLEGDRPEAEPLHQVADHPQLQARQLGRRVHGLPEPDDLCATDGPAQLVQISQRLGVAGDPARDRVAGGLCRRQSGRGRHTYRRAGQERSSSDGHATPLWPGEAFQASAGGGLHTYAVRRTRALRRCADPRLDAAGRLARRRSTRGELIGSGAAGVGRL